MSSKYLLAFKQQAVEKVLMRTEGVTISDVAEAINVSRSALNKWVSLAKIYALEPQTEVPMTIEKKPHDWRAEEKLTMLLSCASLSEKQISEHCRMNGLFPHHLEQWRADFITQQSIPTSTDIKQLRQQNKALQKELNRKEKALAETAALLVLQKKVNHFYADDGVNLL